MMKSIGKDLLCVVAVNLGLLALGVVAVLLDQLIKWLF